MSFVKQSFCPLLNHTATSKYPQTTQLKDQHAYYTRQHPKVKKTDIKISTLNVHLKGSKIQAKPRSKKTDVYFIFVSIA